MDDREKVIKGLDHCSSGEGCKGCPYSKIESNHLCLVDCIRDALALLKEQGKIVLCKDCKYWHDSIRCQMDSEGLKTPDDWFCADGKRR